MRVLLRALICCLALAGGAAQARDADAPSKGEILSSEISVLGRKLDLPPGRWRVENVVWGRADEKAPKGYGAILGLLLVRPDGVTADGAVLIHMNLLPVNDGWGPPPDCAAKDALFLEGAEPRNKRISCSYVRFVQREDVRLNALPALEDVHLYSARLPDKVFLAGLRVSDRRDVIDIRYLFTTPPVVHAANGAVSDWKPVGADMNAASMATINGIDRWIVMARASAQGSLDANASLPLPAPWSREAAVALADEAPAWKLALYRLATYRVMSTAKSFGIAAALAGNLYTGAVVASWRTITHSIEYYTNDLAWEWPSNPPPVEFVQAGGTP